MNRTAYFTTDLAIKTLSKLLKARTVFHGLSNIPDGPIIFVINHFTRLETLLLPYYLYHLTRTPIWSLADDRLFRGGLKAYFDKVGVVSTRDPERDKLIIKTLLTGEAHWIIFPEGRMVKTKKLISNGEYAIGDDHAVRAPHTGAASLSLRAEIFRRFLTREDPKPEGLIDLLAFLGIEDSQGIASESVKIVPVNLTYYPIRAQNNLLSELATRYVKEPSERMLEELMTEGTMMLDGVDIDMQFGSRLDTAEELQTEAMKQLASGPAVTDFSDRIVRHLQNTAGRMMQTYMARIYNGTTINHDHLFASLLRRRSFRSFSRRQLARSVYLMGEYLQSRPEMEKNLHASLKKGQLHLIVDDRYRKGEEFLNLAIETGSLVEDHGSLKKSTDYWRQVPLFHKARVLNPIEVMANEIEPLSELQKKIRFNSMLPDFINRVIIARRIYLKDKKLFQDEFDDCGGMAEFAPGVGSPYILPARSNRLGIVLVHSYLSAPAEMRECGEQLRKMGAWVYGVRLPGHGTNPESLATRKWEEWRDAVERGYAIMDSLCKQVALVGFSAGGSLVLELASRLQTVSAVVAICPPYVLQDYSKRFKPPIQIWNRLLGRWKGELMSNEFVEFDPEIPEINYSRNPVAGVVEVGKLLDACKDRLADVQHPTLVISADKDQVVGESCGRELFTKLGSVNKEHLIVSSERHNIIYGPEAKRARSAIISYIRDCLGY